MHNVINLISIVFMPTKTLTASIDPDLYRRTREAARAAGQAQSTLVAEALSLYVALPDGVRAALRRLPPEAAAQAVRQGLARGLWDDAIECWRAALPAAERRRLAQLSDAEVMERAVHEVARERTRGRRR